MKNTQSTKPIRLVAIFTFFCFLCNAQTSNWEWAVSVNGPSNEDEIDAVASDNQSNVYLSGKFEDSIFVTGSPTAIKSNGMADIMLVKYDSTGTLKWIEHYGGLGEDNVFDAACDQNGNVVISGYFQNTIQIDTINITAFGGFDAFLAKIDPNGNVLWVLQYGGTGDEGGNEVAIANNGQIIVGAEAKEDLNIGAFSFSNPNAGFNDGYILSVNPNGTVAWVRTISGIGSCRVKSIAVDSLGNVYGGGDFISATYIVDELGVNHNLNSNGARDAYITSWDSSGNLRWFKSWGGAGDDLCKGVATNKDLAIYFAGPFSDTIMIDSTTLVAAGSRDYFIWKVDSSGATKWLRHLSSESGLLDGGEVQTDGQGGVAMGIGIVDTIRMQNEVGINKYAPPNFGHASPFFLVYNSNGVIAFTKFADNNSNGHGTFGEISRSGNRIFLDVILRGDLTFGNSVSSGSATNKDAGLTSILLPEINYSSLEKEAKNTNNSPIIYPNPTNGAINIRLNETTYDAYIYDLRGVLKKKKYKIKDVGKINCNSLSKGVYIIKIIAKNNCFSMFFIKR